MTKLSFSTADHYGDAAKLFESIATNGSSAVPPPEVHPVSWQIMWSFLQRSGTGENRFDVSEIGSTWVSSFVGMGAVAEIGNLGNPLLGDAGRFVGSAWNSVALANDKRRFAVPYLADTRAVYYWRDALNSAGVDESSAFETPSKMDETLSMLSRAGLPTWAAPTFSVTNVVHEIASWIWSYGGEFFSADGLRTAVCADEALAGIIAYFNLQQYMTRKYDSLDSVLDAFEQKEAAAVISGPWFYRRLLRKYSQKTLEENLGCALPPGPSFVGGSALVIWKDDDAARMQAAIDWAARLTGLEAQEAVTQSTGLLPVIREAFDEPPYTVEPHYKVFRESLRSGRPLPQVPYWGAFEESLVHVFGNIWSDLKEDPRYSAEKAVLEHLVPMSQQFDAKLYRHSLVPPRG